MIDITVTTKNVSAVLSALTASQDSLSQAVGFAVAQVGFAFEAQAKRNFSGARTRSNTGGRWPTITPPYHRDNPGNFPNVITGNLRRSIQTQVTGFGGAYTAKVFPTMVYARAVELGGKNWQGQPWRNGGYPYMRPAYETVRPKVNEIFLTALAKRWK